MSTISVYVTTYHRPVALYKCLVSIIHECKRHLDRSIEIYVSNNDKHDEETKSIISSLKENYSNLIYSENRENIGIDGNMRKAFKRGGKEQWCLMLGDDDELRYGALDIFFEVIETYKDVAFVLANWLTSKGIANDWETYKLYEDVVECFHENHDKMPYGTIIFNTEYASFVSEADKDRFMGTYHLYSGVLWDMALVSKKVLRIGFPCILRGDKEKTYASYIDDVELRAIPEWYDKVAAPYQDLVKEIRLKKQIEIRKTINKNWALFLMMNRWVGIKQERKNLEAYFVKKGYRRIAIYGMSYVGKTLLNELKETVIQVAYGIDKNLNEMENIDIDILTPDDLLGEVDAIVVTAITFFEEIRKSLSKKVCCSIVSLDDILKEV